MEYSEFAKEKLQLFQEYLDFVRRNVGEDLYSKIVIHLVDCYQAGISHSAQLYEEASQLESLVFIFRGKIMDEYVFKKKD